MALIISDEVLKVLAGGEIDPHVFFPNPSPEFDLWMDFCKFKAIQEYRTFAPSIIQQLQRLRVIIDEKRSERREFEEFKKRKLEQEKEKEEKGEVPFPVHPPPDFDYKPQARVIPKE